MFLKSKTHHSIPSHVCFLDCNSLQVTRLTFPSTIVGNSCCSWEIEKFLIKIHLIFGQYAIFFPIPRCQLVIGSYPARNRLAAPSYLDRKTNENACHSIWQLLYRWQGLLKQSCKWFDWLYNLIGFYQGQVTMAYKLFDWIISVVLFSLSNTYHCIISFLQRQGQQSKIIIIQKIHATFIKIIRNSLNNILEPATGAKIRKKLFSRWESVGEIKIKIKLIFKECTKTSW